MTFGTGFEALTGWLRNQGLEITLIILGVLILHRAVNKIAQTWTERLDAEQRESDKLVRTEESKYRHALIKVVAYVAIGLLYVVAISMIIQRVLDVPITAIVAPATVVGAAIGFGAQKVVQDFLAGIFIIAERQYGYGDIVEIDVAGTPASGTVEDVTLRVTRLRTLDGEVVTIPNGQILKATNQSRDWARSIIDVPVPNTVEPAFATSILEEIAEAVANDPEVSDYILDTPTVMGVERISLQQTTMRLLIQTLPGMQWVVARRVRAEITKRFRAEGIKLEPEAMAALRAGMFGESNS